jgi:hypothetical protein
VIAGRAKELWYALVVAFAAAVVATANAAGIAVDPTMIAADISVAAAVIGLLANQAVNGSPLGRAQ